MTYKQAMLAVLNGITEPISVKVFFERTLRLIGWEDIDPEEVVKFSGLDSDSLVKPGPNFKPFLHEVNNDH